MSATIIPFPTNTTTAAIQAVEDALATYRLKNCTIKQEREALLNRIRTLALDPAQFTVHPDNPGWTVTSPEYMRILAHVRARATEVR